MYSRYTTPIVSVVIPAWNAERFIGETLASASRQTYGGLEIVVVDDGSTDGTAAVVLAAAQQDPRIQLHRRPRAGVAAARNAGVALARGEWIAPLDSDDLWSPDKIEKQLACFEGAPARLGLVYTWTRLIDEAGQPLGEVAQDAQGDVFLPLILTNLVGHGSGPLIRRTCFEQAGQYHTGFFPHAQGCEDWDLYLRIARRFEFAVVPEHLAGYRVVAHAMSMQHRTMARSYALMLRKLRGEVPQMPLDLVCWAASGFYAALAIRVWEEGSFAFALRCWVWSCLLNPVRLLRRHTYSVLSALLLRRAPRRAPAGGALHPGGQRAVQDKARRRIYARCEDWVLARAQQWWWASPSRCLASTEAERVVT